MTTQLSNTHLYTRPESTAFKHAASVSTLEVLVDRFGLGEEIGAGRRAALPAPAREVPVAPTRRCHVEARLTVRRNCRPLRVRGQSWSSQDSRQQPAGLAEFETQLQKRDYPACGTPLAIY